MNIIDKFALAASDINIPTTSGTQLFGNILNLFYFVTGIVAVIVIIVAGFTMTVSGTNPTTVAKARNAVLYAAIGLVVVLSAFSITHFVIGKF
jgi:hypothetical protein